MQMKTSWRIGPGALLIAAIVLGISWSFVQAQDAPPDGLTWSAAQRDQITLWHSGGQLRADDLADQAQGAYDLVSDLIDTTISQPLGIIVWPEGADPSDPAWRPTEIEGDALVLDVFRNAGGDVRNAVTNALLSEATGQYAAELPFWYRAAMGFWAQGPLPGFYLRRAGSVVILDHERYYTFEQLETFPSTWQFQAKYFGQAGGMLSWMIQDWGPESLIDLHAQVKAGLPFYDALELVYEIPQEQFVDEFSGNAERSLLLTWPYIEKQTPPLWERLPVFLIFVIVAAIPLAILLFFIGKRMFYD